MAYEAKFWTLFPSSWVRFPSIGKFFFFLNKTQFNLRHSNPIQRVNFSIWVHEIKPISLLVSVPVKSSRRHRGFPRRVRGDLRRPLDERHAQKHHQVEARHKVGPEHSSCVIFCLECVKLRQLLQRTILRRVSFRFLAEISEGESWFQSSKISESKNKTFHIFNKKTVFESFLQKNILFHSSSATPKHRFIKKEERKEPESRKKEIK